VPRAAQPNAMVAVGFRRVPVPEEKDRRIETYAAAAATHGRATAAGDSSSANKAHGVIAEVYRELRKDGAREELLPLLQHPDASVRAWAATHALDFAPTEGEPALQQLAAQESGFIGFNAQQALNVWREGKLSFP
jgi:hypothetical protein